MATPFHFLAAIPPTLESKITSAGPLPHFLLDMFRYKNQVGRTVEVSHPYADGSPSTDEVRIGDLPLAEGASMAYIFDFGDWWEFDVQLEKVETDKARRNYQATIESYGAAPSQYPDWDDM